MEKKVEFGYTAGKGFVRITYRYLSVDIMYTIWRRLVVNNGFAHNRGSSGFVTVPANCFVDMLRLSRNVAGNKKNISRLMNHARVSLETTSPYERGQDQYILEEEKEELKTYEEFSAVVDPLIPLLVRQGLHICELFEEDCMEEGLIEDKEKLWEDYRQGYVFDITRQFIQRFKNELFSMVDIVEEEPAAVTT